MLETVPCTQRSDAHSGSVLILRSLRLSVAVTSTLALVAGAAAASPPKTSRTPVGEIAFSVHHGDGDAPWDIYVVRTDGRWVVKKTTRRLDEGDPVWSPDGRHIAFEGWTDHSGANAWIYTMNPDGTHRRRLAPGHVPQWSPDGRRIAYDNHGIYIMNADGTGKKRLARGVDPRWSPDGKQLAFTHGPNGDLYVMNAGGGNERRLTRNGDNELGAWAPGHKIVFAHSAINGAGPASGIYIINADGTGLRRVTQTSDYDTPSIGGWSPDGKLILYAAGHGIATWRLSDGSVRRLRRSADWNPTWGPGGRQIAFTRSIYDVNREPGLWIVNRDGSGARRIAGLVNPYPHLNPDEYFAPTWAPR
jgi:Tol biopolymer transport system component